MRRVSHRIVPAAARLTAMIPNMPLQKTQRLWLILLEKKKSSASVPAEASRYSRRILNAPSGVTSQIR